MKLENAIKKLNKVGMKVSHNGTQYFARTEDGTSEIRFRTSGEGFTTIFCIQVHKVGEMGDSQSDYFAGTLCSSLPQAIRLVH